MSETKDNAKKQLVKLSTAFQKNAVNYINALRDSKLGFLRTVFKINALEKEKMELRDNLKASMAHNSNLLGLEYSNNMSEGELMKSLNTLGIDTSDFEKADKAMTENANDPKMDKVLDSSNVATMCYRTCMVAKGKPQI